MLDLAKKREREKIEIILQLNLKVMPDTFKAVEFNQSNRKIFLKIKMLFIF